MPEDTFEGKPSQVGENHSPHSENSPPTRSKGVRLLVWLLILVGFGIVFWVVLHYKAAPATRAAGGRRGGFAGPVTVNVVTVTKGDIGVYQQAIGTVTPVYTDTITSQATGPIIKVNYREGQLVRRGEQLIEIDPRPYQAALLTAQGALERDEGVLAQARMDLDRYQTAWARNAIARQTLDDQEKIVMQDEGTVKADQGTVQTDQVNLSYCNITAPISGRIGLRLVDPGNVVLAGSTTPLAVITQLQPTTVVFTIPEDSVGEVMSQMRHGTALSVDAFDRAAQTKLASGKLLTTDNQIDTTTGTLKLRALFANQNNVLFPNLFVNARVLVNTLKDVTLVPSSAIQHNGDVSFVFLIQNQTAHLHDVKPGVENAGLTEVQGLNPGDVVANSSFEKLQDGSKTIVSKQILLPPTNETIAP
jgi:membrane fusion protein, multidrug efflux system